MTRATNPKTNLSMAIQDAIEERIYDVKALTSALHLIALGRERLDSDEAPSCELSEEYGEAALGHVADVISGELDAILDLACGRAEDAEA